MTSGDEVRVVGTLLETEVADFEGWETEAFEDEVEADAPSDRGVGRGGRTPGLGQSSPRRARRTRIV